VKDIKEAIQQLPEAERLELADWLEEINNRVWDAEMDRDFSPGGRGMTLLEEAEADVHEGRVTPLENFLSDAKSKRGVRPKTRL